MMTYKLQKDMLGWTQEDVAKAVVSAGYEEKIIEK